MTQIEFIQRYLDLLVEKDLPNYEQIRHEAKSVLAGLDFALRERAVNDLFVPGLEQKAKRLRQALDRVEGN